jgi:protein-L-isoaspartate(D-aspartate) O-methyltransferase
MHWRARRNGHALEDGERWITVPFIGTDTQPSPEVLYEARESYNVMMAVLATLPAEQQQAVRLHYLNGLTLGEIGLLTGASVGAIKVRLHRARARLRLALLGEFADMREPLPRVEEEFYMIETTSQDVVTGGEKRLRLPLIPTRDIIVFPHMTVPLFLGRGKSIRAVEEAVAKNRIVFLAAQHDAKVNDPRAEDIYTVGTVAKIVQLLHLPDGTMKLLLEGERRARALRYIEQTYFVLAEVEEIGERYERTSEEIGTLIGKVRSAFAAYTYLHKKTPSEMVMALAAINDPARLADTIVANLGIGLEDKQTLLETFDPVERLRKILEHMLAAAIEVQLQGEQVIVRLREQSSPSGVTGTEPSLETERQRYAEELRQKAQLRSQAVVRAFAQVPREHYLGPGPWRVLDLEYHSTADADPRHLYHNVLVEIDAARQANNGQPSFLAFLIDALELREGEHVVHVGCGTGYYTAILAEVVGPTGRVTAIEIDTELAARARSNLANLAQVEVILADGGEYDPGPVDAILVNAGATHPRLLWLDRLLPGGRLILPLTVTTLPGSTGQILKVTRAEQGYAARFISRTAIFPCIGARNLDADRRLWEAFAKGGWESVRSLRRDQHAPASTCWLHGDNFCLSTLESLG